MTGSRSDRGGDDGGIARDRILVDPGIGFGKTIQHNLQLINGLAMLHGLGCPVMLGASRNDDRRSVQRGPRRPALGGSLLPSRAPSRARTAGSTTSQRPSRRCGYGAASGTARVDAATG